MPARRLPAMVPRVPAPAPAARPKTAGARKKFKMGGKSRNLSHTFVYVVIYFFA